MALPNTSYYKVTTPGGVITTSMATIRVSRLSRGRSCSRCIPSWTGRRYKYVVACLMLKVAISLI
jgi:hypothetical protein